MWTVASRSVLSIGVLAVPAAFARLGWVPALTTLLVLAAAKSVSAALYGRLLSEWPDQALPLSVQMMLLATVRASLFFLPPLYHIACMEALKQVAAPAVPPQLVSGLLLALFVATLAHFQQYMSSQPRSRKLLGNMRMAAAAAMAVALVLLLAAELDVLEEDARPGHSRQQYHSHTRAVEHGPFVQKMVGVMLLVFTVAHQSASFGPRTPAQRSSSKHAVLSSATGSSTSGAPPSAQPVAMPANPGSHESGQLPTHHARTAAAQSAAGQHNAGDRLVQPLLSYAELAVELFLLVLVGGAGYVAFGREMNTSSPVTSLLAKRLPDHAWSVVVNFTLLVALLLLYSCELVSWAAMVLQLSASGEETSNQPAAAATAAIGMSTRSTGVRQGRPIAAGQSGGDSGRTVGQQTGQSYAAAQAGDSQSPSESPSGVQTPVALLADTAVADPSSPDSNPSTNKSRTGNTSDSDSPARPATPPAIASDAAAKTEVAGDAGEARFASAEVLSSGSGGGAATQASAGGAELGGPALGSGIATATSTILASAAGPGMIAVVDGESAATSAPPVAASSRHSASGSSTSGGGLFGFVRSVAAATLGRSSFSGDRGSSVSGTSVTASRQVSMAGTEQDEAVATTNEPPALTVSGSSKPPSAVDVTGGSRAGGGGTGASSNSSTSVGAGTSDGQGGGAGWMVVEASEQEEATPLLAERVLKAHAAAAKTTATGKSATLHGAPLGAASTSTGMGTGPTSSAVSITAQVAGLLPVVEVPDASAAAGGEVLSETTLLEVETSSGPAMAVVEERVKPESSHMPTVQIEELPSGETVQESAYASLAHTAQESSSSMAAAAAASADSKRGGASGSTAHDRFVEDQADEGSGYGELLPEEEEGEHVIIDMTGIPEASITKAAAAAARHHFGLNRQGGTRGGAHTDLGAGPRLVSGAGAGMYRAAVRTQAPESDLHEPLLPASDNMGHAAEPRGSGAAIFADNNKGDVESAAEEGSSRLKVLLTRTPQGRILMRIVSSGPLRRASAAAAMKADASKRFLQLAGVLGGVLLGWLIGFAFSAYFAEWAALLGSLGGLWAVVVVPTALALQLPQLQPWQRRGCWAAAVTAGLISALGMFAALQQLAVG